MFTFPWGAYAYRVLPFGLFNAPAMFQWEILGIFLDLIHGCMEAYMDEFTTYGDDKYGEITSSIWGGKFFPQQWKMVYVVN